MNHENYARELVAIHRGFLSVASNFFTRKNPPYRCTQILQIGSLSELYFILCFKLLLILCNLIMIDY